MKPTKPLTLTFSQANAKLVAMAKRLGLTIKSYTLPSGWTCPAAKDCLSKADRTTGKITDGPHTAFRCFAASSESQYKNTRAMVWRNFEAIKNVIHNAWRYKKDQVKAVADLLESMLPKKFDIMRVHVGGDFFQYFALPDGRICFVVADVTGHGMRAAVPTMVFSGLLTTQISYSPVSNTHLTLPTSDLV